MANLLLIDDEINILKLTSLLLKQQGHQVFTANSGIKALDILNNKADIDLILSDLIMPEMNGFELCTKIGEKYPVVIISAMCQELKPEIPYTIPAIDYIPKPFNINYLQNNIQKYINKFNKKQFSNNETIQLENLKIHIGENIIITKQNISEKLLSEPILKIDTEKDFAIDNIIKQSELIGQNIRQKAGGFRLFKNINFEKYSDIIKNINRTNIALGQVTGIFLTQNQPSDIIQPLFDRQL